MTEPDKSQQVSEKQGLTERQMKAIPFFIAAKTITEGCEKAGIDRSVYYEWLEQPAFKKELDRQRDRVIQDALDSLMFNLTKAVDVLAELLDNKDNRVRRLAANDILSHFFQHKANDDLAKRIEAIEQKLSLKN